MELIITSGRARKRIRRVVGPVFLIGSSMDCDLILGDALVPAVHSYVLITAHGARLRHLGEPPEVRVNRQIVEIAQLEDQDRIDIGCFSFVVQVTWPAGERQVLSLATSVSRSPGCRPSSGTLSTTPTRLTEPIRRRRV